MDTDISDLLKQIGEVARKVRDMPVTDKQQLGEALAPGWLACDVALAAARVREWKRQDSE